MAKIEIKQGAGDDPSKLAEAICAGQSYPFMATITHKAVKPLLVPSTGLNEVIAPGAEGVQFKVKSFEQAWVVVTDSAALAARYNSDKKDFVVIEVPDVVQEQPVKEDSEVSDPADGKKPATRKGADSGAGAVTE
ncbi:hypothetical protein [Pseudomonas sp. TWP3-2]|uniref:hypothetical protein n=1 Tax=Pseudomonas sp. TWP3-2 TaxID=2804574 RepID=UPI003CEFF435